MQSLNDIGLIITQSKRDGRTDRRSRVANRPDVTLVMQVIGKKRKVGNS